MSENLDKAPSKESYYQPSCSSSNVIKEVSIDCVVFGLNNGELEVLVVRHGEGISKGGWALPGGFILVDEDLDAAASRLLKDLTGLDNIYLEQLQAFGGVDRFPGERVVTIAYYALVRAEDYNLIAGFTASHVEWQKVSQREHLIYDHDEILEFGLGRLKHKVQHEPIGFNLLPEKFTLLQLQELYEAILDVKLDKPNFRRKMTKMGLLVPCNEKQKDVPHRAAALYRFDKEIYEQLTKQGFSFEV
ncbi:NUDIX hydrolase [Saccharophagus degradans]|uniref:NUDIX hydrolase n=1 Tax=Saccharophagus degradans (strain 2-40 / ATCC 43961 / DSM 17024) TaxID=203122 RepID=Q21HR3_SACD2|nr:NUDIX domain-containing protein [Saccharophagus degradans]ABD81766.1 NUDIX hydrolase [Saccharophagus degradans 2-40]MBU2986962.1 NUDIX domain-containing protein [Saccharophagus degradans]WGP00024.1 NUDIX domain-containing protein [Saccharophagus degradans]